MGEASSLGNIGNIYQLLGDYPQALDYQEQSLVLIRELGDRAIEAKILNNIGFLYERQEDDRAIASYQEAVSIYEEIRKSNQSLDPALQASYTAEIESTYRRLSALLRESGRTTEAEAVLDLLK